MQAAVSGPSAGTSGRKSSRARGRTSLIAQDGVCPDGNSAARKNRAVKAMICMTNYARSQRGLKRYRTDRGLNRSASLKAADILRCNAFSHTACGRPFTWWIEKKYTARKCWWASENIAWGSRAVGSVRDIFEAWMKSPGHRAAILSKRYAEIGVGFRVGEMRGRPTARVWVQHFGRVC